MGYLKARASIVCGVAMALLGTPQLSAGSAAAAAPTIERVSVRPDGSEGPSGGRSAQSDTGQLSLTGRFVAFQSYADLLGPTPSGLSQAYLRDRVTGSVRLVSANSTGGPALGGYALPGAVSTDGRYVFFNSDSYALVDHPACNDCPGGRPANHLFVRDLLADHTEQVDVSSQGDAPNDAGNNYGPGSMSPDGRFLVFCSTASNLVPGDTNGGNDVFVRDRVLRTTERVSLSSTGAQLATGACESSISNDGRFVAFHSSSTDVTPDPPSSQQAGTNEQIYLRDRARATTILVSHAYNGEPANNDGGYYSYHPTISGDGRFTAFMSGATNIVPGDTNGVYDVFVYDAMTGTNRRVSVRSNGSQTERYSTTQWISNDGSTIMFHSIDPGMVVGEVNETQNVFAFDTRSGAVERVTRSPIGSASTGTSLSGDGRLMAVMTNDALVPTDANGVLDLYVFDRGPGDSTAPVVSGTPDRAANGAGWYNAPVTVAWSSMDPAPSSGAPSVPPATVASTEGRNVSYSSGQSCDPSGNCATGSVNLSIDRTVPTVGAPAFGVNPKSVLQSSTVTAPVADELSGVAGGELFVGADPGVGRGTAMSFSAGSLTGSVGSSLIPGVYPVGVRSRDLAGNWSATASAILVVYDPAGGFATGGGWVVPSSATSDPGDQLPGLDGTSKANFGFVVKYQTGSSSVPSGNLQFNYNAGKFRLQSLAMDWLVVTNQNMARFKGTASIEGASGSYPFQVEARDGDPTGQPDRFSIKIFAPGADVNAASPMYKASGDVSGGQVTIHRA